VVSIFALSLTVVDALRKLNVFFWFGVGFGIPLLVLSFLSGAALDHMPAITRGNLRHDHKNLIRLFEISSMNLFL
jgi:hypothetical protein